MNNRNNEIINPGISMKHLNSISKDILRKIGHLSVPAGLYSNLDKKHTMGDSVVIPVISRVLNDSVNDGNDIIDTGIFDELIDLTSSRTKSQTRKKNKKKRAHGISNIIKIKTIIGGGKTKKNKKHLRNKTKKGNKRRKR
tara:strand:- start:9 stop:428 length:420 start_codon:yes stop_codon:yes gene_type:complete